MNPPRLKPYFYYFNTFRIISICLVITVVCFCVYCRMIVDAETEVSREVCRPFIKTDRTQPEASVENALSVLAVHQGLVDTAKVCM